MSNTQLRCPVVNLVPLDNAAWGFTSSCFVCERGNESGLRIPFFHDVDGGAVVADFSLDDRFSGAPNLVHGGVTLAILDEAMAWAAIALAHSFALTRTTTARFLRPVEVGGRYRVVARLEGRNEDGSLDMAGAVRDDADRPCVEASAVFVPMTGAQADAAIGGVGSGSDGDFVRG